MRSAVAVQTKGLWIAVDDFLDLRIANLARLAGTLRIREASQAVFREAGTPLADGRQQVVQQPCNEVRWLECLFATN